MKLHITLLTAVLLSACITTQAKNLSLLADYKEGVTKNLQAAGENRAELEKAITTAPKAHAKAVQFLIAYMPERDAKALKADYILKNVAWSYKARETFPWAKNVPEDIFLNDVLPYASLNERRDDWREDFFNRFSKHVKGAKTQHEALMAVNKHIMEEVKVKYSTKRKKADQSPYESMEQGLASCTGLSIL
ncbi:MAG: transglutaminase domain-containing protein, partial [Akkermansiaceae bacterium]